MTQTIPATLETELTFTRFDRMSERYPERTAVVYLGESFSFRRLRELSERFAGALNAMGIAPGDRVMVYLANSIQWVIAFLGIQKIGAVVVPVSPIYTSHEITYMIRDCGITAVVCMDTNFGYVREAAAQTGLKHLIVTNLADLLPAWKKALGKLFDKIPSGKVEGGADVRRFRALLRHPPVERAAAIDPEKDLAYILYTGGTTGFPKGVPGTHIGMTSYVNDVTADVAGEHLREGDDSYIAVNPLFHIMALGLFMAIGLNKGNCTVLMPVPEVDAILESIQRRRVRWLLGVPALYRMILENDRIDRYDLGSLKYCFCGGDVLPEEVKQRWRERCGVPIYQVYGSTEVGHVAYSRIGQEPSPRAIGFPLKSRQCLIVDPETLAPVAAGESGELLVTSDFTLKHYFEKPEETRRAFVEVNGRTWCRMGDFVSMLPSGELIYVERSADIIKHKGYRVSASEVEAALQDHPTVIGACVVGIPDPKVGERIKAIVVLKEDARGVGGTELMRWCRERLAPYKVPAYIEFRDMLPKSKVGKLLRREVRDDERRRISKDGDKSNGNQRTGRQTNSGGGR
jgi:long-chain acyl-CoA synthetase